MMYLRSIGIMVMLVGNLGLLLACGNQETPTPQPPQTSVVTKSTSAPFGGAVPTMSSAQPLGSASPVPPATLAVSPPPPPIAAPAGAPPNVVVEQPSVPAPMGIDQSRAGVTPGTASKIDGAPPVPGQPSVPLVVAPPPEPAPRDAQEASARLVSTQNPFAQLVPEATRSSAPDWLKEGTRLIYDVKSASIPRDRDQTGAGGAGLIQVDVVGIENLQVACSIKLYLDIDLRGTYHPNIVADSYNLAGSGEYWVHPALLNGVERVAKDELKIARIPLKIGDRSFKSVRFEYAKGTAKYVWSLDETSGVLLFHSAVQGTGETARQSSTVVTLVGVRQLSIPWSARSVPGWVSKGAMGQYNGTITVAPFGAYPQTFPISIRAEVKEVARRWTQYVFNTSGPLPSLPSYRVTGVSQLFDGMWLPAEAISNLKAGQVLDRDPVTGATIGVSRGVNGLVITESGRAYRSEVAYDERTGAQNTVRQETTSGVLVTTIELRSSQR